MRHHARHTCVTYALQALANSTDFAQLVADAGQRAGAACAGTMGSEPSVQVTGKAQYFECVTVHLPGQSLRLAVDARHTARTRFITGIRCLCKASSLHIRASLCSRLL